jgi:hypothetical protein
MVQIQILKTVASAKGVWGPGEVATVDPDTAAQWCAAGIAERVHGLPDAPDRFPCPPLIAAEAYPSLARALLLDREVAQK